MPSTTSVVTLPNLISIGRMLLVPAIVVLTLNGDHAAALAIFVVAGLSDAADGIIAARFDMRSELGAVLDPLADKILLVSIFVVLAVLGELPVWLVALVVGRDLAILAAVAFAWITVRPLAIRPLWSSKVNTAMQIVLAGGVLTQLGLDLAVDGFVRALIVAAGVTTVVSSADYVLAWWRQAPPRIPESTTGHT